MVLFWRFVFFSGLDWWYFWVGFPTKNDEETNKFKLVLLTKYAVVLGLDNSPSVSI